MARSTLRQLKDYNKKLTDFATSLGLKSSNWEDYSKYIALTEDFIQIRQDKSKIYSTPQICLDANITSKKILDFYNALFQPDVKKAIDIISFPNSLLSVLKKWKARNYQSPPIITKGVSYPSSLQKQKTKKIIKTDNFWLIDLFAIGYRYTSSFKSKRYFYVVDTTIYEGWNQFSDNEIEKIFSDLPKSKKAEVLVERFMNTINEPKYQYVIKNKEIRGKYLQAIAETLGLNDVIRMENKIQTEVYQKYLNKVLDKMKFDKLFSFEGYTNARDFTPFVFAEELFLREEVNADICVGPLREDLPLNLDVLKLNRKLEIDPTPIAWYTRPSNLPKIYFDCSKNDLLRVIEEDQNNKIFNFIFENLDRIGKVKEGYTKEQVIDVLYDLITKIRDNI
ncbi:hypothetical protein GF362_02560 [Candidatus Dojkabacteria bacterium]|nr:hypothetical protein [Candidatus Dojkabacteria bacterium]